MGYETTDQKNSGRRQTQRFSVSSAISASKANQETKGVEFLQLKNCLVDRRLGDLVKRPGSLTESISGTLGIPLGIGERKVGATGAMPLTRDLLANFGGTAFRRYASGSWSTTSLQSYLSFSTTRKSNCGNGHCIR